MTVHMTSGDKSTAPRTTLSSKEKETLQLPIGGIQTHGILLSGMHDVMTPRASCWIHPWFIVAIVVSSFGVAIVHPTVAIVIVLYTPQCILL